MQNSLYFRRLDKSQSGQFSRHKETFFSREREFTESLEQVRHYQIEKKTKCPVIQLFYDMFGQRLFQIKRLMVKMFLLGKPNYQLWVSKAKKIQFVLSNHR